jgi:glycosyltransferase involved in cell wall biosynthesis
MVMVIMFWILGASLALELFLEYAPGVWRARKVLAPVSMLLTAFSSGGIFAWHLNVFTAVLLVLGLYRVFNLMRITENRMHEAYLRSSTKRSSLMLALLQVTVGALWLGWDKWHATGHAAWSLLAALQLAGALVLLASLQRTLKHTHWPVKFAHMSDTELPTVTVAIPARNETEDLEACLRNIIASDYPKLEILVLDDCSQTKRTAEIIRDFAHDGVRFIRGEEPSETWLPKNQAYNRLAQEASGEYILFCGVDVRFAPETLRQLLSLMTSKKKEMVGVLPHRPEAAGAALTQAMRYWWELVPPRRQFQRPPVLSTCWIISRKVLEDSGGFVAVARSITPEAYFARHATKHDAYSFLRASAASGLESVKGAREQRETAIRTRYPQLHRRPENVAAATLAELTFLLLPFVSAIAGFWISVGWVAEVLAAGACLALIATYELLTLSTRTGAWPFGLVGLPIGVAYNVGLLHYSMWQYEFSTVDWKGRNICIPAMHVIPHLPKID